MTDFLIAQTLDPKGPVSALPGTAAEKAKQLPQPKTYHLLCLLPEAEKSFEGGIVKADVTMHHEEILSPVLFVVSMGPDAFQDTKRFPHGPSCKEGDFIVTRANTGTRMKIHGREFRIIVDESVQAVVEDPRGIQHV